MSKRKFTYDDPNKDRDVIFKIPKSTKEKFFKFCKAQKTTPSRFLRACVELTVGGHLVKNVEQMRKMTRLVDAFSEALKIAVLETEIENERKKIQKRKRPRGKK